MILKKISFAEWLYLKEASEITGEYWIDDSGSSVYADADIGDVGHEGYVIGSVQRDIMDSLGYDKFADREDFEGFKNQLIKDFIEEKGIDPDEVDEDEIFYNALEQNGVTDEEIAIAEGRGNARVYAMKNWGWKAVRGHHVESWTLTPRDMQIIARGIEDVLDQEGGIEDENEDEMEFTVSSYQHSPITMTLAELRTGRPEALNIGATHTQQMQQALTQQAASQMKELERQKMDPYYRQKEEEKERRYLGIKDKGSTESPWQAVMKKADIIKPGQKWWAPHSENYERIP